MKLKVEGVFDGVFERAKLLIVAPIPSRDKHILGRRILPEMDSALSACAIQITWIAARAKCFTEGWFALLKPEALKQLYSNVRRT